MIAGIPETVQHNYFPNLMQGFCAQVKPC